MATTTHSKRLFPRLAYLSKLSSLLPYSSVDSGWTLDCVLQLKTELNYVREMLYVVWDRERDEYILIHEVTNFLVVKITNLEAA